MDRQDRYIEFCKYVLQSLCRESQVEIEKKVDEMGTFLLAKGVKKADMGNVIGKQGATINSVRTLLRIVGIMDGARVSLKLDEPEGSPRKEYGQKEY